MCFCMCWLVRLMKIQAVMCNRSERLLRRFRLLPEQFDHPVRVAGVSNQLDEHA